MSKYPIKPSERKAAKHHDRNKYVWGFLLGTVLLIPPTTPIGILILVVTVFVAFDERGMRR